MIPPEDLLVVKAVATAEHAPHHRELAHLGPLQHLVVDVDVAERAEDHVDRYDALAIIARQELDWDHVVKRARGAGPRRVLSLL